jgi:hypothetical protein
MLVIARGWEREGDGQRALAWLHRAQATASAAQHAHATAELIRALIHERHVSEAREQLAQLADPKLAESLRGSLLRAERRDTWRWIAWSLLAAAAIGAAFTLRRAAGSWRAAARRLARPPVEVMYFAPIALVLVIVAFTGNPLVARAVRTIALAGAAVAWLSGAILDAVRARRGRVRLALATVHAVVAALAVAAATYLAIDRDQMIDLVIETWHSGPAAR